MIQNRKATEETESFITHLHGLHKSALPRENTPPHSNTRSDANFAVSGTMTEREENANIPGHRATIMAYTNRMCGRGNIRAYCITLAATNDIGKKNHVNFQLLKMTSRHYVYGPEETTVSEQRLNAQLNTIIGHCGDNHYRPDDPTNSTRVKRQSVTKIQSGKPTRFQDNCATTKSYAITTDY